MERMNEILARAASRRISTRRTPSPAPTTPSTTTSTRSASSPSGPRHATPRHIMSGQATSKSVGNTTPLRSIADADASQPTPPTADVLDNDRILELPTRAPKGITRPADARPAEMASIRELAPTYAAQAGQRRMGQAASPTGFSVAPSTADAPTERARNGVSSAVGGDQPGGPTWARLAARRKQGARVGCLSALPWRGLCAARCADGRPSIRAGGALPVQRAPDRGA